MKTENDVRRKVKTASVAGGVMQGYHRAAERGFQILPPEVGEKAHLSCSYVRFCCSEKICNRFIV